MRISEILERDKLCIDVEEKKRGAVASLLPPTLLSIELESRSLSYKVSYPRPSS